MLKLKELASSSFFGSAGLYADWCNFAKMSEKRIDPIDGMAYTLEEMSDFFRGKYKKVAIKAYFENECTPVKGSKAPNSKAKAKEKAKATAKDKSAKSTGPGKPKRFTNESNAVVTDSIDGLVWSTPNMGRLDTFPDIKAVYRTDWDKSKVAIISGGGAGHEPMHGGFVGKGMLTAAVSGETFASPTIDAVLSAIVQVTGPKGCLVVIKNYTGDRLNFSLAAARARSQFGLNVQCVIIKDDVATVAERGIAGTLFVHKIAGAAAEAGESLEQVAALAQEVIDNTASMGVSFSSVLRLKPEMIAPGKMEIGLGIHGEPGARTENIARSAKIVDIILEEILHGGRMKAEAPEGYACLVNNLGGVPPQEMNIIVADLMKSKWADTIKLLVGPAPLCTSMDMNGVSLSLLRLNPSFAKYLKAETSVHLWPPALLPEYPKPIEGIKGLDPFENVIASTDKVVLEILEKVCKKLIDSKQVLNDLDAKVGDADCGSTMAAAGQGVLAMKDKLPLAEPKKFCQCLGAVLGRTMGGSSGVLMAIMWTGMANSFEKSCKTTWESGGAEAFRDGLQAMMDAGGASTGSRTMLDALVPASEALLAGRGFAGAKEAAGSGALATKNMAPRAGRSENVPEKAWRGVEDPGARAAALVFAELA